MSVPSEDASTPRGRKRGPRRPTVLLVGFMTAGKSQVGRILARRLDWPLVDVDRELESRHGATVAEIFREKGEPWFREAEAEITAGVLTREACIVVPGGGWAAVAGRLRGLPEHVVSVWLRISAEEAVRRAARRPGTRPLLSQAEDPLQRARDLLEVREPHYAEADLHLDTDSSSPLDVADRILIHLRERMSGSPRPES